MMADTAAWPLPGTVSEHWPKQYNVSVLHHTEKPGARTLNKDTKGLETCMFTLRTQVSEPQPRGSH